MKEILKQFLTCVCLRYNRLNQNIRIAFYSKFKARTGNCQYGVKKHISCLNQVWGMLKINK